MRDIDLTIGWNFISLKPTAPILNAKDACTQITAQGGEIGEIARWSGDNWISYICGLPFGDFELVPQTPYFINSSKISTWTPESGSVSASQGMNELQAYPQAVQNPTITDIRFTNISNNKVTLVWQTDGPATGQVHFGTEADGLINVAYDDRGEAYVGTVHQVTLYDLSPETAYQLAIHAGESVDDNEGQNYTVATYPLLGIPSINTAYGQALDTAGNPIIGAQVYATVEGAAPLSTFTDRNGYWTFNLGSLRMADGEAYFAGTEAMVDVEISAPDGRQGRQSIAIGEMAPAPTLVLELVEPGYHIYLPVIAR